MFQEITLFVVRVLVPRYQTRVHARCSLRAPSSSLLSPTSHPRTSGGD